MSDDIHDRVAREIADRQWDRHAVTQEDVDYIAVILRRKYGGPEVSDLGAAILMLSSAASCDIWRKAGEPGFDTGREHMFLTIKHALEEDIVPLFDNLEAKLAKAQTALEDIRDRDWDPPEDQRAAALLQDIAAKTLANIQVEDSREDAR